MTQSPTIVRMSLIRCVVCVELSDAGLRVGSRRSRTGLISGAVEPASDCLIAARVTWRWVAVADVERPIVLQRGGALKVELDQIVVFHKHRRLLEERFVEARRNRSIGRELVQGGHHLRTNYDGRPDLAEKLNRFGNRPDFSGPKKKGRGSCRRS